MFPLGKCDNDSVPSSVEKDQSECCPGYVCDIIIGYLPCNKLSCKDDWDCRPDFSCIYYRFGDRCDAPALHGHVKDSRAAAQGMAALIIRVSTARRDVYLTRTARAAKVFPV